PDGGDPLHPASPRSRSRLTLMAATRFTRLRRARDRD
ncbi:membrane protein, partial [Mycobacterium nebraskense]